VLQCYDGRKRRKSPLAPTDSGSRCCDATITPIRVLINMRLFEHPAAALITAEPGCRIAFSATQWRSPSPVSYCDQKSLKTNARVTENVINRFFSETGNTVKWTRISWRKWHNIYLTTHIYSRRTPFKGSYIAAEPLIATGVLFYTVFRKTSKFYFFNNSVKN